MNSFVGLIFALVSIAGGAYLRGFQNITSLSMSKALTVVPASSSALTVKQWHHGMCAANHSEL